MKSPACLGPTSTTPEELGQKSGPAVARRSFHLLIGSAADRRKESATLWGWRQRQQRQDRGKDRLAHEQHFWTSVASNFHPS